MNSTLEKIHSEKIISIIRSQSVDELEAVVHSLYEGGIRVVEVTMNTPGALKGIEMIRKKFPDMKVGAGTVLDEETARMCILSGASFLLSPILHKGSLTLANRYHVPLIPGVLTPTEIVQAYELGAQVVKIFPISSLGPQYVKDIKGPLPHVNLIPVGGVNIDNISAYLDVDCFALGLGSSLVSNDLIKEKRFAEITERAKKVTKIVTEIKETKG
ncbi:bifunctional 4-hydroxy-2-oxoglutarate aldolase/2-dehydro-3-deoxy-phosphogluconate aldolase [Bacillus sp. PS06]|uniref:bifunctional 4-hydroxy-2-oxoglutarate aldolase/2-dehydro-3-deoxy-phosphogluconate aldolase n=1 Tax=Bacillus sp. PS06 TaxID=2764176 RepID=UPI0017834A05|nr:bifunctional 4-hydroxy-2-oxoglutarate aldolase/2-dehydro-3-deoxy-phosphogluconate aldolase [Bacillus sp. PS06]MBD8068632.1 bifunctional 4-hydroxy-2-oxoglutarate aldolase/2-dehydro-3-deoxy-phosphogluconate aldolase [Bacillus sp. PS06]